MSARPALQDAEAGAPPTRTPKHDYASTWIRRTLSGNKKHGVDTRTIQDGLDQLGALRRQLEDTPTKLPPEPELSGDIEDELQEGFARQSDKKSGQQVALEREIAGLEEEIRKATREKTEALATKLAEVKDHAQRRHIAQKERLEKAQAAFDDSQDKIRKIVALQKSLHKTGLIIADFLETSDAAKKAAFEDSESLNIVDDLWALKTTLETLADRDDFISHLREVAQKLEHTRPIAVPEPRTLGGYTATLFDAMANLAIHAANARTGLVSRFQVIGELAKNLDQHTTHRVINNIEKFQKDVEAVSQQLIEIYEQLHVELQELEEKRSKQSVELAEARKDVIKEASFFLTSMYKQEGKKSSGRARDWFGATTRKSSEVTLLSAVDEIEKQGQRTSPTPKTLELADVLDERSRTAANEAAAKEARASLQKRTPT